MNPEYWKAHAAREPLPVMAKPCHDCAITSGFYVPYADDLLEQPQDIQENAARSWYCHSHPDRACKGLQNYMRERG